MKKQKAHNDAAGPRPRLSERSAPLDELAALRRVIRRGNARWRQVLLLKAVGLAVAAPLGYLWLVFLIDNVVHLPTWGRLLASVLFFAGVGALAWRLSADWRRIRLTEDRVALAVEQATPGGVQNRLINSIQIARDTDRTRAAVRRAVVLENYDQLRDVRLQPAARAQPALLRIALAAAVVSAGVILWWGQRERFTNAATRIFLPFSNVSPLYETTLLVEPGNVEVAPGDEVTVRVQIEGRVPGELVVLRRTGGERTSVAVPVKPGVRRAAYTFEPVKQCVSYAVRGGDFVSPYYTISVSAPCTLRTLAATYRYPEYTKLPERKVESAGGDLEALFGTKVSVRFLVSQPVDEAAMCVDRAAPGSAPAPERVALSKLSATEFAAELMLDHQTGYQLELIRRSRASRSGAYSIHVLPDQPPELEVHGLETQAEVNVDSVLPLTLEARDDYGLIEVGLGFRHVALGPPSAGAPANGDWQSLKLWSVPEQAANFKCGYTLAVAALGAVEGEQYELTLRGRDTDPERRELWTSGERYRLAIGGTGVALQLLYEQMLRSEAELKVHISAQQKLMDRAVAWMGKLDPGVGVRWDDQKNLDELAAALREQAREQSSLRQAASASARAMVEPSGSLRVSLGMLADTEMVRTIRILEAVASRDTPQAKRSALAEARLTQERTLRSLNEILLQYVEFRKDWELLNMTAFTRMLAERQSRMAAESLTYAKLPAESLLEPLRQGTGRRQAKLLELTGLAQSAFAGLTEKAELVGPILADAFAKAATALGAPSLKQSMQQASDALVAARWEDASKLQEQSAGELAAVVASLLKAQAEAAQQALADLQKLAASSLQAQKELERLKAGTSENLVDVDLTKITLEDIIRMQHLTEKGKSRASAEDARIDYMFEEHMKAMLQAPDTGKRQDPDILSLARTPSGQMSFPNSSDRTGNRVTPHIQEKFKDLVGDLLEEADDLRKQYETYNLNAGFNINEPGNVGKQGGDLNSTAAASATGNMKPPTHDFGGASRSGRQGARAHGLVVGDESVNRRGRDEALESQDEIPDQAGRIKEVKSDDEQKDTATGIGGKLVDSDESAFSVKDAGEWNDKMAERMQPAKDKHGIVERQGKPLDPKVAELLRDLDSEQQQVIERVKAIKKELDNLYLPTEELEELMNQLTANLDRMKEKPEAEVFRQQMETLDKLKSAAVVYNRASSEFEPSLLRGQVIRGRVLDEPAVPPLPGYEEAVKRYFQKLSGQE